MPATISGTNSFVFGFDSANAPTGITGFTPRSAELTYEPEVYALAIDGQGSAEAVQISKKAFRKIMMSVTGYITSSFDGHATAVADITFQTLKYHVKKVGVPYKKGEFVEVTIDAECFPLIT